LCASDEICHNGRHGMKPWAIALWAASSVLAEDPALPTLRSFAGAFIGEGDHNYFVESELRLPVRLDDRLALAYQYREATPFLDEADGIQAEVFTRRQEAEIGFGFSDDVRLIAVGGYRTSHRVDGPGLLGAYAVGGGIGSPLARDGERLQWSVTGGAFLSRRGTSDDWWVDAHGSWRAWDFAQAAYRQIPFRAALTLTADFEFANDGRRLQPFFRVGPAVELLTAHGNRAQFQLQWYHNDHNAFAGDDENAFLFGLNVISSVDTNFTARSPLEREPGWLPLIWGAYDLGFASTRSVSRFEMNVELIDFAIAAQPFTGAIWYESRQEYRVGGDFDNIAYSVTLGVQTPVGTESYPLVAGADFLHRSDHALNPSARRVAPGTLLANGSHNLFPRLRLQTAGWDLPYRDHHSYDRHTGWLHTFDWRVTAGWNINDNRDRGKFAGQLGLNWDLATVEGYVVYARGLVSMGNETPDWLGELGVRRPIGKIFTRIESYGIKSDIAHGDTFVVGVGVNL
jgi:hypothetical protein